LTVAPIEAVLFDWGGTLTAFHSVDLLDAWRAAAHVLAPDREDDVAAALLDAEREVWARTATTMRSATTGEVLHAASAAVGLPVEAALHERAVAAYLDGWAPTSFARPGAVDVMRSLRQRGLRTGLLSNTHWPRGRHEEWLARDGLLDLLDARIYTSDLEHVKPHPAAFAALLDAVGVAPEHAVFVGDRPHDDIWGAQAVGMRAVWMRTDAVPSYDVEPDAVIDDLGELVAVVDRWTQPG
jgi:putative hydrolase of the HAD superfamily